MRKAMLTVENQTYKLEVGERETLGWHVAVVLSGCGVTVKERYKIDPDKLEIMLENLELFTSLIEKMCSDPELKYRRSIFDAIRMIIQPRKIEIIQL